MGMLETQIKRIPEGKTKSEYIQKLLNQLEDHFSDYENSCESYEVKTLTEENFDEVWKVQDTYKDTPEIKEKYKNLAKEGQLVYIEIDY
jgi:hypothetical protein